MAEDPGKECDVDDLMCQFGIMSHLQGMRSLLGSEKFQTRYPEFTGLEETVANRISEQEVTIKEALERCGRVLPEEVSETKEEL